MSDSIDEPYKSFVMVLGAAALVFVVVLYSTWAWAVAASFTFDWFMHPMFPRLPTPTMAQLVGFSAFVCIIGPKTPSNVARDTGAKLMPWFAPWIILGAAYGPHMIYEPTVYLP